MSIASPGFEIENCHEGLRRGDGAYLERTRSLLTHAFAFMPLKIEMEGQNCSVDSKV